MTREEAIELVKSAFDAWEYKYDTGDDWSKEYEARDMAIESLEQTRWIPASERLPKTIGVYRVTKYYPNNVMNPRYIVDACYFDGSNTWYNDNRINHERAYADNVIAWQENPEPYKSESEVTDADSN